VKRSDSAGSFVVKSKFRPEGGGGDAGFAERFQGDGAVPLGEPGAVCASKERMMEVSGDRVTEERLEHAMEMGRLEKIDTANDVGDPLEGVVVDDREVVTRSDVFADKDGVTEAFGPGLLQTVDGVGPGKVGAGPGKRFFEVETEGVGVTGGETCLAFPARELSAEPGIEGALAAVGSVSGPVYLAQNVAAGAEAGIQVAGFGKRSRGGGEIVAVFALVADGAFPLKPQPGQVLKNGGGILRRAAGRVDVFDAQEKTPTPLAGEGVGEQGRVSVALVE